MLLLDGQVRAEPDKHADSRKHAPGRDAACEPSAHLCRSRSPASSLGEDTELCRGLRESGSRPAATSEGSIRFSLPLTCAGRDSEQLSTAEGRGLMMSSASARHSMAGLSQQVAALWSWADPPSPILTRCVPAPAHLLGACCCKHRLCCKHVLHDGCPCSHPGPERGQLPRHLGLGRSAQHLHPHPHYTL